ncbi:cytochrome c biogenesis CcdA family protein [Lysinibacillus sp. BW-2-10]|uniref:cytochrome c biogenesis CcdA family protein n=1 Tax=Lysinibacillus sp. BW-2-10 TaxID=2590030 RepID=UPI001180F35E|nr:cytochrome c biogenesis protein CcdA [Lysinibacillus sp. BW-2-10]TSI09722.1 cytochrome c biogenesis protein CcdA [Lysinibacillus sp. BW-2-10]
MVIQTDTVLLVGMLLAFGAGAISFLSPCVLPLFPAYLSYITGISVMEIQAEQTAGLRKRIFSHSIIFLLGIGVVFISLGASASFLGQWLQQLLLGNTALLIQRLAGIFIVFMGFVVAGWLTIPLFMKERRLHYTKKSTSFLGTFFVGLGFAAGWTPCIGPIFASILLLAATNPSQGLLYTLMYVIGFAVPFIILTFFVGSSKWILSKTGLIMKVGGAMMILMGILLFFGQMPRLSAFLLRLIDGTWLSNLG